MIKVSTQKRVPVCIDMFVNYIWTLKYAPLCTEKRVPVSADMFVKYLNTEVCPTVYLRSKVCKEKCVRLLKDCKLRSNGPTFLFYSNNASLMGPSLDVEAESAFCVNLIC